MSVLYDSYSSNRARGRRLVAEDSRDNMQDGVVKSEPNTTRIERVLKVHNMQKTDSRNTGRPSR
ncbi:hypothetical protein SAY86_013555 [Trapa natans]|uniref:Uncharacterized protein n=1 Tax=Trapa natans TaxID=22666 RepID=A0AAN7KRR4_TRANT|nr:hypothetical protein SAY86_013555 [Trapa natans]